MTIKDLFDQEKFADVNLKLRQFVVQHKDLQASFREDSEGFSGQVFFDPYALSFKSLKDSYCIKVFAKYENYAGKQTYFEIKKHNLTPSLINDIEKSWVTFQNEIEKDVTGQKVLENLKLTNSKIKMKLNEFFRII